MLSVPQSLINVLVSVGPYRVRVTDAHSVIGSRQKIHGTNPTQSHIISSTQSVDSLRDPQGLCPEKKKTTPTHPQPDMVSAAFLALVLVGLFLLRGLLLLGGVACSPLFLCTAAVLPPPLKGWGYLSLPLRASTLGGLFLVSAAFSPSSVGRCFASSFLMGSVLVAWLPCPSLLLGGVAGVVLLFIPFFFGVVLPFLPLWVCPCGVGLLGFPSSGWLLGGADLASSFVSGGAGVFPFLWVMLSSFPCVEREAIEVPKKTDFDQPRTEKEQEQQPEKEEEKEKKKTEKKKQNEKTTSKK